MSVDTGDLGLVQRVQKGDKTAFDLLVRKYQHKVVKLVTRYLRDPSEAEDVAQEAFIKAYRAIPQFRGDSALRCTARHQQERHRLARPQSGGVPPGM
jgi:RNA polymerase sigma-70 factor (ECF subfamily)